MPWETSRKLSCKSLIQVFIILDMKISYYMHTKAAVTVEKPCNILTIFQHVKIHDVKLYCA